MPLEKGKAPHSSILAWRIPWTVWSLASQRVGHNWATLISLHEVVWDQISENIQWWCQCCGDKRWRPSQVQITTLITQITALYCFHPSLINNVKEYFYLCWSLLTKSASLVILVAFPKHVAFDFLWNVSLLELLENAALWGYRGEAWSLRIGGWEAWAGSPQSWDT